MTGTAPPLPNVTSGTNGRTMRGADAVLRACARAGVIVTADGPHLDAWTEDGSPLPVELIAALRAHKSELLAILNGKQPRRGRCWTCGAPVPGEPDLLYAACAGCAQAALERLLANSRAPAKKKTAKEGFR